MKKESLSIMMVLLKLYLKVIWWVENNIYVFNGIKSEINSGQQVSLNVHFLDICHDLFFSRFRVSIKSHVSQ